LRNVPEEFEPLAAFMCADNPGNAFCLGDLCGLGG
jgi:hypothetical protein